MLPASVAPIDATRHFAIVPQLLTPVDPDAVVATIAALPLLICALPRLGASMVRCEALAPMIVPANSTPPGGFAAIIPLLEHDHRSPFRAMQRVTHALLRKPSCRRPCRTEELASQLFLHRHCGLHPSKPAVAQERPLPAGKGRSRNEQGN